MPDFIDPQLSGLETGAWLAAIIECSDDAIISKTLDGVITSWNAAAQSLFGFTPEEAIGQPITIIIPDERLSEETEILAQVRRGERIEHFETLRRTRGGELVHVSVTVSPVRDGDGQIQGASKILRDITQRKLAEDGQKLLLREMDHRIKNLFAVTSALVTLSARDARSVEDLVQALGGRIKSLARAHALTLPDLRWERDGTASTPLSALLHAILEPFPGQFTITLDGQDLPIGNHHLSSVALMLHELTMNAAKYGALSTQQGRLTVHLSRSGENLELRWTETGGPSPAPERPVEGFGSRLVRASLNSISAKIERQWREEGLVIVMTIPPARV